MSIVYFSYPRITVDQANRAWSEARQLSLSEIRKQCDNTSVSGAEFYPFAQARAEDDELREVRKKVLGAAVQNGYPGDVSSRNKVAFESDLIEIFNDEISMSLAEATHMDVWHFFNVRLFMDITLWRFGSYSTVTNHWTISPERIYSFNRNMFGRIWWRNHLLGSEIATSLGEDATVQIVERAALFSHPPFARAVATRALSTTTTVRPGHLLRAATILFGRRTAVLSIYAMSTDQLCSFVNEVFTQAEFVILSSDFDS